MPGWHDATLDLQQAGELQVVGIIQEQHPDRCRLFMQWKRMEWPILVDSLNLLEVEAVPITVAIDEYGIVREKGLKLDAAQDFREGFMKTSFEPPADLARPHTPASWPSPGAPSEYADSAAWSAFADQLILSGDGSRLDAAIDAYQRAIALEPDDGWTHFRLGVALRRRNDSAARRAGDFQQAVNHWKAALDVDPNQYIWRRRIQQYGARLDKPYPFYDWVPQARAEILARGDTPAELLVEPQGAEFAQPQQEFEVSPASESPDPQGRIHRDDGELISIETTAVPASLSPGEATRLHIVLRPRKQLKAHWNNELHGLELWAEAAELCSLDQPYHSLENPPQAVSTETRRVELEVRCDEQTPAGSYDLSGYALYYVCEDAGGTCLYRRQDYSIALEVR